MACVRGYEDMVRQILHSKGPRQEKSELEAASLLDNARLSKLIVEAVAHRRTQLQLLIQMELPAEKVKYLNIRPDTLLDRQCVKASQLLLEEGIEMGELCPEEKYSVYDTEILSIQTADQLWDAGFKDVDEADELGYTSLMKLNDIRRRCSEPASLLKKATWLISKGADMYRNIPGSTNPAVFSVSHAIGRHILPMSAGMQRIQTCYTE
jgi:hypothetical protein